MTLRTLADKTLPLESRRPSETERGLVKDQLPSLLSSFRLSSDVLHSVSYHFKFVTNCFDLHDDFTVFFNLLQTEISK